MSIALLLPVSILAGIWGCATIRCVMTQPKLSAIYTPIEDALGEVRQLVADIWKDVLRLVHITASEADDHLAEGKLLRPALCLLAAGSVGEMHLGRYARMAAAYEAMHIASLAHDDVVDHASLRRGQYALNVLWSDHAAVLGGDFLVARALELLLEYESPRLVGNALAAVRRMAEGELRFFGKSVEDAGEEECIALADTKTASLFAAACSSPALLVSPDEAEPLYRFGISLGIAFQLIDDLLDITQSTSTLGKPSCGDVAEGKHTLPIYLMCERMTPSDRKRLRSMQGATLSDADRDWIMECAGRLNISSDIQTRAAAFIEKGIKELDTLAASEFRHSMEHLARFILVRNK